MRSPPRIVLLGLFVFVVTGCAGPKISSSTGGFEILWAKPGPPESLAIRLIPSDEAFRNTIAGKSIGEVLVEGVHKALEGNSCLKTMKVLVPFEPPETPFLLEVRMIGIYNGNRGNRAQGFDSSSVVVAGRFVDVKRDIAISIWSKSREGTGGLLGLGGFLVPADEELLQSLVSWVAEDIAVHVKALCTQV
jgi:hypothetical protein